MRIVLITGLGGSGKSTALRAVEDLGYYAVDNMPVRLLDDLVALFSADASEVDKVALVVDARTARQKSSSRGEPGRPKMEAGDISLVPAALERIREAGHRFDVVFLDASDDVLERRYSETRRKHPLSTDGSVMSGIASERNLLQPLRDVATQRIDTSGMSVHQLRREIQTLVDAEAGAHQLTVSVMSFGFKHGPPTDADLVFDVRFLPNPFFVDGLRPLTGETVEVSDFVLNRQETQDFLAKVLDLLLFLLPKYEQEGKSYLTIAIGCTGGRHRSVAVAIEIGRQLTLRRSDVRVRHRDITR